jgi:hypothetical protein
MSTDSKNKQLNEVPANNQLSQSTVKLNKSMTLKSPKAEQKMGEKVNSTSRSRKGVSRGSKKSELSSKNLGGTKGTTE